MGIGSGDFESRTIVKIDGDASGYLKAKASMERADAAHSRKIDGQIAKTLQGQGKLTEEAFKTAKAVVDSGRSWEGVTKQIGFADKAMGVMSGKLKAIGSSMLSGIGMGIVGGVLGGSVTSLVQKLFQPPSGEDMDRFVVQMKDAGGFAGFLARDMKKTRDHVKAVSEAKAWVKDALDRTAAVDERYSPLLREKKLMDEIDDVTRSVVLNEKQKDQAVHDVFQKYQRLAEQTERAAKAGWSHAAAVKGMRQAIEFVDLTAPAPGIPGRDIPPPKQVTANSGALDMGTTQNRPLRASTLTTDEKYENWRAKNGYAQSLTEEAKVAVAAFDAMSGASMSFYDSIVDGSMSAGAAFKKFVNDSMKALGKQALGESLYQVGQGFAKWPYGNHHFVSAGKLALAAAALGAGAYAIGSGGGGGSKPSNSSSSRGTGGGGEGTHTATIVLSHSYTNSDNATQRREAERMAMLASRKRAVERN